MNPKVWFESISINLKIFWLELSKKKASFEVEDINFVGGLKALRLGNV